MRHLRPNQLTEPLPEPMHRHGHRSFAHAERLCRGSVIARTRFAGEPHANNFVENALALVEVLATEVARCRVHHGFSPHPVKDDLWSVVRLQRSFTPSR